MKIKLCALFVACLVLPCAVSTVHAENWTRFRGPNGTGISDAKGIPTKFGEEDYNWKIELPGIGHSQPVVWNEKIFVNCGLEDGSARILICLDRRDGKPLWKKRYSASRYRTHHRNSYASSTPTVDSDRVYFAILDGVEVFLIALDHSGNEKWRESLGAYHSMHGFGASPMIFEDLVIFPKERLRREDDPEMSSMIFALERKSGHLKWKTPRKGGRSAYGTPYIYESTKGRPELLLTSAATGIYSIEARTGKPLWDADVFTKRTVSSPVVASGLVFGTCGSGGGGNYLVAVRPGGQGDVKDTHVLYELKRSIPYVPTPVARGNRLYLWSDDGVVSCVKPSTGEIIWQERVKGSFTSSPVWIDGRLFSISDRGHVVVVAAADEFRVLARNDLGEPSRSTPAVAGGRLYLRTYSHLISVGGKKLASF